MEFLLVDDDFGARRGVAQTLADFYPGVTLHEAGSLAEATKALAAASGIGLVLLDLNVEDSRGLDTLRALKAWCEDHDRNPRIVVMSAAADYDDALIPQAIEHCATGFIVKGTRVEVFRSAIDLTLAGSIYIPERYLQAAARRASAAASAAPAEPSPVPPSQAGGEIDLTERECDVLALLVQGLSYKQIARRLSTPGRSMSDNTVRVHVQRIAWKLRVADQIDGDQLTAKAAVLTAVAQRRLRAAPVGS